MRARIHTFHASQRGLHCRVLPCIARRSPAVAVNAAKKGGDKKGGDKKGPKKSALADLLKKKEAAVSSAGATPGGPAPYDTPEARMLAFQMCDSYWRLTKKYLVDGVDFERLPAVLYRAPFALLAHNRFQEGVTDPIYTYGNKAAQELFETTWDELMVTPSRKSAVDDPTAQQDRNALLDRAAETGLVTGFEVWRVSKSGRKFKIKDGTLFNIMDREGNKLGQAAVIEKYELEDGTLVQITGAPMEELEAEAVAAQSIPTPEDIAAAEAAVSEQAAKVRELKEVQGLTNQDIPVQLAVLELKKRKEKVAALQKRLEDALAASRAAFDDDEDD